MPTAPIGPVADVITGAVVTSDWGNATGASSQGRVVHRFNSTTERDTAITAPTTGMLCYVATGATLYLYTAGGWRAMPSGTPAPLAAGAGFTSYTDPAGDVWVAKGGVNGGAWRRARDVLNGKVARGAVYSIPVNSSPVAIPFDTVVKDPFAMWTAGSLRWTIPLTGRYASNVLAYAQATATAQLVAVAQMRNGATLGGVNVQASMAGALNPNVAMIVDLVAGDTLYPQISAYPGALSSQWADVTTTWMTLDYLGTG
jgi:hypothetical protein